MQKTINSIDKLLESINSSSLITVEKLSFGNKPTNKELIEFVLKNFNLKLSEIASTIYNNISSLKLKWKCNLLENDFIKKYDNDDEQIYGEINIQPIEVMIHFDEKLKSEHWTGNFEKEELKDLENFRSFDIHDEFIRMGFFIINGELSEDLYFIESGNTGFSKAPFSFEEYFQMLIKYKGFLGWQYNILYKDTDDFERMEHYISQIFK